MEINQVKFAKVVEAAKAKVADRPEWLRAVEKAAKAILNGKMIVTILTRRAVVTTDGGTYEVVDCCSCEARTMHCYHRAGVRLIEMYEAEPDTPRSKPEPDTPPAPRIVRSVERDVVSGCRVKVTRCDNWII